MIDRLSIFGGPSWFLVIVVFSLGLATMTTHISAYGMDEGFLILSSDESAIGADVLIEGSKVKESGIMRESIYCISAPCPQKIEFSTTLPAGFYNVTVTKQGFEEFTQTVHVPTGDSVYIDFYLVSTKKKTLNISPNALTVADNRSLDGDNPALDGLVSITLDTKTDKETQHVVVFEIRDSNDITNFLVVKAAKLNNINTNAGENSIRNYTTTTSWRPEAAGHYIVRTFVIAPDIGHPEFLSEIKTAELTIDRAANSPPHLSLPVLDSQDIDRETRRLMQMNKWPHNNEIDQSKYPKVLGSFSENGFVIIERYYCSDVCPDYGRVLIHYRDIQSYRECLFVGGTLDFDPAWASYLGCRPR